MFSFWLSFVFWKFANHILVLSAWFNYLELWRRSEPILNYEWWCSPSSRFKSNSKTFTIKISMGAWWRNEGRQRKNLLVMMIQKQRQSRCLMSLNITVGSVAMTSTTVGFFLCPMSSNLNLLPRQENILGFFLKCAREIDNFSPSSAFGFCFCFKTLSLLATFLSVIWCRPFVCFFSVDFLNSFSDLISWKKGCFFWSFGCHACFVCLF